MTTNLCDVEGPFYLIDNVPQGTYTMTFNTPSTWKVTSVNPVTVVLGTSGYAYQWFSGQVAPPSLEAVLTADTEVVLTKPTNFSARASGSATGTINYSFWWDCDEDSTDVTETGTLCGILTKPSAGQCIETPGIGYKCDGVSANPKTTPHTYEDLGTYTPKVIIERGTAEPAEARITVDVVEDSSPEVVSVSVSQLDYCATGPGMLIERVYDDPDNNPPGADPQHSYQVQVATDDQFTDVVYDRSVTSISEFHSASGPEFDWNTSYYVRVRVEDSGGLFSEFTDADEFPFEEMPLHAYPSVNFKFTPSKPLSNEEIQFEDTTIYDGGASGESWDWKWKCKSGGRRATCILEDSTDEAPTNTFFKDDPNGYETTLTVIDSDGYTCDKVKDVPVGGVVIPGWREVAP